jgi:hypothetical protein
MRKRYSIAAAAVVAAAVAVATVTFALPSAAATQSTGDCYAQLDAVRAEAGVPQASATAMPALAKAAASHAGYRAQADTSDLSPHHETAGRQGFTGVKSSERTKAAGLEDGTWSSQFENVTTTGGALHGVQSWVDAPYHRFPMLDANNRAAGCSTATTRTFLGRTHAAAVLELAATWAPPTKRLTMYPAPGQTGVPVSFNRLREQPSPFADAASTVGYVISFQADGYAALKVKDIALSKGASHTPVAVHKAVRFRTSAASGSLDANLPANAAMLTATQALDPHTTYHVQVSGQYDNGSAWTSFPTRTWSFTTA